MGTEFISLYLPAGCNKGNALEGLYEEVLQAKNIKDKELYEKVHKSLISLIGAVKLNYESNGMALFVRGETGFVYPYYGKTKLYWCDKEFYIEPLIKDIEGLEKVRSLGR